jgi:biotin carboxyl carrier protein
VRYDVEVNGRVRRVVVERSGRQLTVSVDGRQWAVDAVHVDGQTLSLLVDRASEKSPGNGGSAAAPGLAYGQEPPAIGGGASYDVSLVAGRSKGEIAVRVKGAAIAVGRNGRRASGRKEEGVATGGPQRLAAPMPGKVVRVLVTAGEAVRARQPIVVVEAMKMENELRAQRDGRVAEVLVKAGQPVEAGAVLAVIADS